MLCANIIIWQIRAEYASHMIHEE